MLELKCVHNIDVLIEVRHVSMGSIGHENEQASPRAFGFNDIDVNRSAAVSKDYFDGFGRAAPNLDARLKDALPSLLNVCDVHF